MELSASKIRVSDNKAGYWVNKPFKRNGEKYTYCRNCREQICISQPIEHHRETELQTNWLKEYIKTTFYCSESCAATFKLSKKEDNK